MMKMHPKYLNFSFLNGNLESFDEDNNSVFVLMPFGKSNEDKKLFNQIFTTIKDVVEKSCFHGGLLSCSRADLEDNLIIMEDVSSKIKKAGLTIFDISYPNLNVYFELGLACALDKKILLIFNKKIYYESNENEQLPFDINQFRYLEYSNIRDLEPKLKLKLESLIKLSDYSRIDFTRMYEKIKKLTRHFNLDTKSDQIKEDWELTDYEIEKASDVLDEYWNNEKHEANNYINIEYMDIEIKIRQVIGIKDWNRVKALLRYLYWNEQYQPLIAHLKSIPSELFDIKRDFESGENKIKG